MELVKPMSYSCTNVGPVVVLKIGKKTLKMDYHSAIRMAAFLSHSGKQAKKYVGDNSKGFIGLGTLTDAGMDALKAQKRRDGTATFLR
jgi:hypothetical protein